MNNTIYRYPHEIWILALTITFITIIFLLTMGLTLCIIPIILLVYLIYAFTQNQSFHQQLIHSGALIDHHNQPELNTLTESCADQLHVKEVEFYLVPSRQLNAYTFGLSNPKGIVLYSPLLKVMDQAELRFIIGHELGHIALGHSFLKTLLGGVGGISTTFSTTAIYYLIFRWWNRACEYSADRAGLLACGDINKAISAMVKLVAGPINSQQDFARALQMIDQEDDSVMNNLTSMLSTHPMFINRIEELKQYASSSQYLKHQKFFQK